MPEVKFERPLRVPAIPARSALSSILHDIANRKNEWADFALVSTLGSLGLPDVGYVAVPVDILVLDEQLEPRHQVRFEVRARKNPEAFPVFKGAAGIEGDGPSTSGLWLGGSYDVPLHGIGLLFDKTVARGMAEKTLENMVDAFADGVAARVERREIADSRYRLFFRAGD